VISKNALYRKSAKGTEAIANRQHGLGPKLRQLLILVDGRRKFGELARLSSMLGDTEQLLDQLLADGFIEQVATHTPSVKPVPRAASAAPLPQAQRFVVRRLTDIMGPSAEQLCIRIETTRNWQEFDAAVAHAQDILRGFRGAQLADTFAAEISALRSQ
jgi:hypothetical protein